MLDMAGMAEKFIGSPEGQKMLMEFLSSQEGLSSIRQFASTPEGKQLTANFLKTLTTSMGLPADQVNQISNLFESVL